MTKVRLFPGQGGEDRDFYSVSSAYQGTKKKWIWSEITRITPVIPEGGQGVSNDWYITSLKSGGLHTQWKCRKKKTVEKQICFTYLIKQGLKITLKYVSRQIYENVLPKWTFCVQTFFRPKTISKVAIIKTTIAFFLLLLSFSSLFLFLLSFSFVTVILELLGPKKPAFWRLFTQMTANFVRLVFKKSAM